MWYDLHLVMWAHKYGIEYGLPISTLEFRMRSAGHWTNDSFAVVDPGETVSENSRHLRSYNRQTLRTEEEDQT